MYETFYNKIVSCFNFNDIIINKKGVVRMFVGECVLLDVREVQMKNGKGSFRVAKLGNKDKYSNFEIYIDEKVDVAGLKKGDSVICEIDIEKTGYNFRITLTSIRKK